MNIIEIEPDQTLDLKSMMKGKAPANTDPIITESTVVKHKTTGETLLIYIADTDLNTDLLINTLSKVKFTKNVRTSGLATQSEIIGYRPRLTGSNSKKTCSKTAFGNKYQYIEDELYRVAQTAEKIYAEHAPARHQNHASLSEKVHTDYRMPETSFTSGIVNKNNPLRYHLDTGNFKDVFSIMLGLKQNSKGGNLHLPQLHLNLEICNGSLTMFDGQSLVHGVTPILGNTDNSYRFTIVFYSLIQMWNCLETVKEVELARAKEDEKLTKLMNRVQGNV